MEKKKKILTTRELTLIALLITILFVQEQALSFIPNVQLTVFLLVVYSKKLGLLKTSIIIFIHVLLDNLIMGSFNLIFVPFMFIGWMFIPILLCTAFKKVESNLALAFLGVLLSFLYSRIYIIPNCLILEVDFVSYFIADIIWEVLLAASSFLTILLLYKPSTKAIDKILRKE